MRIMMRIAGLMLAGTLSACAGDTCWMMCTDHTRIQRHYVDARDSCREMAELKAGVSEDSPAGQDKQTKAKLVNLFGDCMTTEGWTIAGDEKKDKEKDAAKAATAAPDHTAPPIPQQQRDQSAHRAAECNFARQNAHRSPIDRRRAEACDLECDQMQRAAPDAPKPAACQ